MIGKSGKVGSIIVKTTENLRSGEGEERTVSGGAGVAAHGLNTTPEQWYKTSERLCSFPFLVNKNQPRPRDGFVT